MDVKRAQEIKNDPDMKNVLYHGDYVYIESVDDEHQKAVVHFIKRSETGVEVDLAELKEE